MNTLRLASLVVLALTLLALALGMRPTSGAHWHGLAAYHGPFIGVYGGTGPHQNAGLVLGDLQWCGGLEIYGSPGPFDNRDC